ncbi:MAG TPA: MFS transporter [Thermoplasmata archaeon]|nr:MFS transporter [Thermoplasmata archaeon]
MTATVTASAPPADRLRDAPRGSMDIEGTTGDAMFEPQPRPGPLAATVIVAGLFLAILMGALDQFVVLTALPNIVTDLGSPTGAAFVVSAYLVTAAVGIAVFGRLADMYSRRSVMLAGLATFIVGSMFAGLSQNVDELIAFRGLQGFASNAFIVVGLTIVADVFPAHLRARIVGAFTGTFVIATIAGPFLGSFLVDHSSWRWVFYINVPIAALAVAALATQLPALVPRGGRRFDFLGGALLATWITALTLALVQNADAGWGWGDPRILSLVASGLVALVAFVAWELRAAQPLVPLRMLRGRVLAASSAVSFLRGVALFSLYTFLSIYVGLVLLKGAPNAADTVRDVLYFLVVPAVFGAAVGSQLVTRTSYRQVTSAGLGLATLGALLLTQVSRSEPLWTFAGGILPTGGLILPLLPIGLGVGLTFPVTVLSAQFSVGPDQTGSATALVQFFSILGGALGVSALTALQAFRLSLLSPVVPSGGCPTGVPPTPACQTYFQALSLATFTSIQELFVVAFGLLLLAFLASLLLTGRMPETSAPRAVPA